jgi:hypothetical protein
LTTSLEVPLAAIVWSFFFKKFLNVQFAHFDFVVFNYVQWALNSSRICAKANFFSCEVSQYRNLSLYSTVSSEGDKVMVKLISITCEPNPVSIYENFSLLLVQKICACNLLEFFDAPILKLVYDIIGIRTNGRKCHECQILNQSTSLAFWSFSWTNHSPMTVV